MKSMLTRNVKLYFKDKANVFFSMLSIIMIIVLFALFLGQGNFGGTDIMNSWLMAGVLGVAAVTTSLGAFTVMVEDKVGKITKGFYASPIKRSHIAASYILSPFIVSVMMTVLTAIVFGLYIVATGGDLPAMAGIIQIAGLMLLSSIMATAMVCFIVSYIKTNSVFGTVSAILGTLIGFLMGIYMPIGQLPGPIQIVIMLFPPSHAAMLYRRILMERPLEAAMTAAPYAMDWTRLKETLGVVFMFGDVEIAPVMSIVYMVVAAGVFFGLSLMNIRKPVSS